jgi:hypothetical protein
MSAERLEAAPKAATASDNLEMGVLWIPHCLEDRGGGEGDDGGEEKGGEEASFKKLKEVPDEFSLKSLVACACVLFTTIMSAVLRWCRPSPVVGGMPSIPTADYDFHATGMFEPR